MSKIVLLMDFKLSRRVRDHYVPSGPIDPICHPGPVVLPAASQDGLVVWGEGATIGCRQSSLLLLLLGSVLLLGL